MRRTATALLLLHVTPHTSLHTAAGEGGRATGITPNTGFLTNYLKGVESTNKRVIARNAARGAQQVCSHPGGHAASPALDNTCPALLLTLLLP
jgi:hypothetical protein